MNEVKIVPKEKFSENLKYYLQLRGVMQKELANYVGVSAGTIVDWKSGRSYPRMDKIQKIAEYLRCEPSDLIEDRSFLNNSYTQSVAWRVYQEIINEPQLVEMFQKIIKMSDESKVIISTLTDKLLKEEQYWKK